LTDLERQKLLQDSQGLLAMFNGLLRIAEVESGKHSLEMQHVELKDLIQDVVELFEPVAQEKGLTIKTDLTPHTHRIDRDLLFQALINLLENALKFTPHGGEITLTLSSSNYCFRYRSGHLRHGQSESISQVLSCGFQQKYTRLWAGS
jgi:signal transduction histidine kinase